MAKIKIQTGLRLDEDLYAKVKELAEIEGRSLNNLVEFIVKTYITEYERDHGSLPQSQN